MYGQPNLMDKFTELEMNIYDSQKIRDEPEYYIFSENCFFHIYGPTLEIEVLKDRKPGQTQGKSVTYTAAGWRSNLHPHGSLTHNGNSKCLFTF